MDDLNFNIEADFKIAPNSFTSLQILRFPQLHQWFLDTYIFTGDSMSCKRRLATHSCLLTQTHLFLCNISLILRSVLST
jgi:hypothetical protein